MSETKIKQEVEKLLGNDLDELFILLVPKEAKDDFYSKDGLLARGKSIFYSKFQAIQKEICSKRNSLSQKYKNKIDLAVILTTSLANNPTVLNVPLVPLAVLIIKIGLENLCDD